MKKKHKFESRTIALTVISIMLLIALIFAGAYALVIANTTVENTNITMSVGSRPIFNAEVDNQIVMDIEFDIVENGKEEVVGEGSTNLLVSLSSEYSNVLTQCSYDIVWTWDETDNTKNQYIKSDGVEREYVFDGQKGPVTYFKDKQVPNYDASNRETILYSTSITTNGTLTEQKWVITSKFILTGGASQNAHLGAAYNGKVSVENVVCRIASDFTADVSTDTLNNIAMPTRSPYTVAVTSPSSTVAWDNKLWGIKVDPNLDSHVDIEYTSMENPTLLSEHIMDISKGACSNATYLTALTCEKAGGTWTDSFLSTFTAYCSDNAYSTQATCETAGETWFDYAVVNENGYRYQGDNPNNYVWFNEELWRIIGVFETEYATEAKPCNTDSDSDGHYDNCETGNLVKIIRNDSMGGLSWNNGSINDWTLSSLKVLMNEYWFEKEDATESDYCCGYNYSGMKASCDYSGNGLKEEYRDMVVKAKWHLGTADGAGYTASQLYEYERGTTTATGIPKEYVDYVGLMYVSDYGYAPLVSDCARGTTLSNYYSSSYRVGCTGNNWLYGEGYEWYLTPYSDYNAVFYLKYNGQVNSDGYTSNGYVARQSLYLVPNVYVLEGEGSAENPYVVM